MDWNARADAIAADKRLPPPVQGRALAMMHVAMFEAVNAIERRYMPYRLELVADRNTSREAAAASRRPRCPRGAVSRSDGRRSMRSSRRDLSRVAEGPAKERGIILGRKAAADLLELRAADGARRRTTIGRSRRPGVYVPTQPVAGYRRWRSFQALGDDERRRSFVRRRRPR